MRLKRSIEKSESPSMSTRKLSLFNRWKNQNLTTEFALEGISEEELVEYKEAFRLFDKVSQIFHFKACFLKITPPLFKFLLTVSCQHIFLNNEGGLSRYELISLRRISAGFMPFKGVSHLHTEFVGTRNPWKYLLAKLIVRVYTMM